MHKRKDPNTYWWHNLHHTHVLAASVTQLHPHNLGEGRDTSLGSAVRWIESQREICQRGASEEEVRLSARLCQGEKVWGKRLSDQVWCNKINCDLADNILVVGRLEDHVVVLNTGVDEDSIEFGKTG